MKSFEYQTESSAVTTTGGASAQVAFEVWGEDNQGLSTTALPILFSQPSFTPHPDFSISIAGIFTYTGTTKTFELEFKVRTDSTGGTAAHNSRASIFVNNSELVRSRSNGYSLNNQNNKSAAVGFAHVELNNGDTFSIRAREENVNDQLLCVRSETNLSVVEILS